MIPVELMVIISMNDTTTVTSAAARGPLMKPVITITTSLRSKDRKPETIGNTDDTSLATNAIAHIMPSKATFFEFFILDPSLQDRRDLSGC